LINVKHIAIEYNYKYFVFSENIENAKISIFDITVKLIFNKQITDNQIHVGNLQNGVYTIKIEIAKGMVVRKFVKNGIFAKQSKSLFGFIYYSILIIYKMENTNTQVKERVYTKSVHIFPSEKSNCGVISGKCNQ
jgi:hypothetical protein